MRHPRVRLFLASLAIAGSVAAAPLPTLSVSRLGNWRAADWTRYRQDLRDAARRRAVSVARERRDAARARSEARLQAQEIRREARQLVIEKRAQARRMRIQMKDAMRELRDSLRAQAWRRRI